MDKQTSHVQYIFLLVPKNRLPLWWPTNEVRHQLIGINFIQFVLMYMTNNNMIQPFLCLCWAQPSFQTKKSGKASLTLTARNRTDMLELYEDDVGFIRAITDYYFISWKASALFRACRCLCIFLRFLFLRSSKKNRDINILIRKLLTSSILWSKITSWLDPVNVNKIYVNAWIAVCIDIHEQLMRL